MNSIIDIDDMLRERKAAASLVDMKIREVTPILKAVHDFVQRPMPWDSTWTPPHVERTMPFAAKRKPKEQ